jgi:hypothetical protein
MRRKLARLAIAALALCVGRSVADDGDGPAFSFSGFGTLGIVHSSEDLADFTSSTGKPRGAGHSAAWSAEPDSLAAAQVAGQLTRRLSTLLQVVVEQGHDGSFRPRVEWANVKYEPTADLSVRVGRTVLPVFMLAETRKVTYAMPWVRPPVEVYSLVPLTSNDGVDASYRLLAGGGSHTLHLSVGQTDSQLRGTTVNVRDLALVADTYEWGFATARVSFGTARLTLPGLEPVTGALRQFGAQGRALAEKYEMERRPVAFFGVGATYDPARWFVTGEWSRVAGAGVLGTKTAWYLSGGYRFGKLTPYVTYADARADRLSETGLATAGLPPAAAATASRLNSDLNVVLRANVAQATASLGTRWDFARNAALTLQYDRTRVAAASNGLLANLQPGFQPGGRFDLVSANIGFVFR